ncbi:MAG: hypothetical protein QNJ36_11540 [Calothrix sp. MO_167.B42]|nr:hypothetical protein [Calothrix sp. MO_167.B42]
MANEGCLYAAIALTLIELSVLSRQCLERRIPEVQILKSEIDAWQLQRNQERATVNWCFKTIDARHKFERFYPTI